MLDLSKLKDKLIYGGAFFALFVAVLGVFWSMYKQSEIPKTDKVQNFVVYVQPNKAQVEQEDVQESDISNDSDEAYDDEVDDEE